MVVFLLKSSACLAVFLMFYKLLLEKERMHTFKRYYLLVALVLALTIPSITFVEYVEVAPVPISYEVIETIPIETETTIVLEEPPVVDWTIVLWTIYALGVLFFSLRFLKSLFGIVHNIRNNPKLRVEPLINVLLNEATVPHTFFNYIFLNRKKFEANAIPKEVLVHEAAHAKQKHSLDILFVELLQIIFWFSPLVYLTKNAIKLNHEFLADQTVLTHGTDTPQYQNILLAFASSASYKDYQPSMVNAINYSSYSSIKKRFTAMKTRTSKKSILMRSLLLLPLFASLLFGFSESRIIETPTKSTLLKEQLQTGEDIQILINKSGQLLIKDQLVALENLTSFLSQLNGDLSKKEREKTVSAAIIPDNSAPVGIISDVEHILNEYGVARIDIVGPETLPSTIASLLFGFSESRIIETPTKSALLKEQLRTGEDIQILINKSGQLLIKDQLVALENLTSFLSQLNGDLSKKEREKTVSAAIIPDNSAPVGIISDVEHILNEYGVARIDIVGPETLPSPILTQNGVTQKQLFQYNALAKKYNAKPKEKRVIPSEDLKSLEHIYRKMSVQQKADALPFPECPDSKSNPQEGATPIQTAEYNALAKKYNAMLANDGNIRIRKSDVDLLEYLHGIMTETQRANAEPLPDFPNPPEPPAAPAPAVAAIEAVEPLDPEKVIKEIIANQDPYDGMLINKRMYEMGENKEFLEIYPKVHSHIDSEQNSEKNKFIFNYRYKPEESSSIPIGALNVPRGSVRVTAGGRQLQEGIDYTVNYQAGTVQILDPSLEASNTPIKISIADNAVKSDVSIPPPPTPPKPKPPLDYVIEMAKKDARFYYEGKEVSSDKAIDIMKKNKNLNIDSKSEEGKRPVVKLSEEPYEN